MKTLFDDDIPRNQAVSARLIGGPCESFGRVNRWFTSDDGAIWFEMRGFAYDYESPGVYRYRELTSRGEFSAGRPFATLTPNGAIRPSVSADADF